MLVVLTHETTWVCLVSPDFAVNLDQFLLQDRHTLIVVESILQAVTQKDNQGQTFPSFVWPSAGFGCLKHMSNKVYSKAKNTQMAICKDLI